MNGIIRWIIDAVTGSRTSLRYYVGFDQGANREVYVLADRVSAVEEQNENRTNLYVDGAVVTVQVPAAEVVTVLDTYVRNYIG